MKRHQGELFALGDDAILERKALKMGATGGCFEPPVAFFEFIPESKSTGERRRTPVATGERKQKPCLALIFRSSVVFASTARYVFLTRAEERLRLRAITLEQFA